MRSRDVLNETRELQRLGDRSLSSSCQSLFIVSIVGPILHLSRYNLSRYLSHVKLGYFVTHFIRKK